MITSFRRTICLFVCLFALVGCSEDQQNQVSRIGVSWLDGNYRGTYAEGQHVKSWEVNDGKVTSEPQKGYYYFWTQIDGKKAYVQTPIARTYIEEMP